MVARVSFALGRLVATPAALAALQASGEGARGYLLRHMTGDWGDVDAEDQARNNAALENGERIFSGYTLRSGERLWIITEAADDDGRRRSTCVLLPEDY